MSEEPDDYEGPWPEGDSMTKPTIDDVVKLVQEYGDARIMVSWDQTHSRSDCVSIGIRNDCLTRLRAALESLAAPVSAAPARREEMAAFAAELKADPAKAQAFFQEAGILDAQGNLTPQYGGREQALPDGWVPLVVTLPDSHPEEVAYGPKVMMDRLGKWLAKHFAAVQAQAEPVAWMAFGGALVHAVTRNAMDPIEAERFDVPLYLHPPAAPQQAEPVAQIGWADEFGNLFPMGAWKPAQRTHHDAHKTAWRPVFLHPPAAEVQQAEPVGDFQRSAPGKIWMNLGNDGMDEIEYPTWDALVRADENITRSEDRIDATDIPYVRADLAHPPAAEVQRLRDAAGGVLAIVESIGRRAFTLDGWMTVQELRRVLEGGE